MAGCVAKSPAARWQRMQKIIMELKLLTVAARRADATPAARGVSDSAMRAEIQQLEARLNARLQQHESSVSQLHQAASGAVNALKDQLWQPEFAAHRAAESVRRSPLWTWMAC